MSKFKVGDRVVFKFKSKKESVTDRKHGWLREMNAVFKLSYITIDKIFPSTFHSKINGSTFVFDEYDFILYKEEEEVEYKIKPHITFGEIYEKVVDLRCDDALREWNAFLGDCFEHKGTISLSDILTREIFNSFIYKNPTRLRFVLKHGFIEKMERETYKLGDIFIHDDTGASFQLIGIGKNKVALVIIDYSTTAIDVQDMNNITEKELQQLSVDKFKKVK
uniref:Uncharacterized protein n=1 Tax=viral metagenome TaxID=1070528 RepID=A0A6H2A3I3_9ZZZZ